MATRFSWDTRACGSESPISWRFRRFPCSLCSSFGVRRFSTAFVSLLQQKQKRRKSAALQKSDDYHAMEDSPMRHSPRSWTGAFVIVVLMGLAGPVPAADVSGMIKSIEQGQDEFVLIDSVDRNWTF